MSAKIFLIENYIKKKSAYNYFIKKQFYKNVSSKKIFRKNKNLEKLPRFKISN